MDGEIKIFDYRKLNVQKQLGRGTFGTVYLANCDELQVTNPVVMKVMHKSVSTGDAARKLFMKEARLLAELHHENIVQMHGICMNPLAIILEYVCFDFAPFDRNVKVNTLDKGLSEIASFTRSEDCVFDHLIPAIANDITKGLSHLHHLEVAHRDLKPANILISNQHYCALRERQQINRMKAVRPVVCKLGDFGESRSQLLQTNGLNDPSTRDIFRGTIPFMAPEILLPERMLQGRKLSLEDLKKVDIWALGLVFYCVINPGVAYPYEQEATDLPDIIMMLRQRKRPTPNPEYRIKQKTVWSRVKEAFECCTNFDSSKRPNAPDVVAVLNPDHLEGRNDASMTNEMPLRYRSAAKRRAGATAQSLSPILGRKPARVAADQWYAGTQGQQALKYIFAKLTNIADSEVKMSRKTDSQDVTLSFEANGQHWLVTFPNNFPRSNASLTASGENCTIIGGDSVETAIDEILNRISSVNARGEISGNPAHVAADQWYAGKRGEAALKLVLDRFANIADRARVEMSRTTDTQNVTMTFERHGQEWQVAFPNNFPRSSASLTCFGELHTRIGGDTIETAVSAMIDRISSLDQSSEVREYAGPQVAARDQWYVGEKGEAALKYIFDELRNIADSEVKMTRNSDTQDLTLSFYYEGQDWQVEFPSNFPRSYVNVGLSTNEEEHAMIGGYTVKTAINAIVAHIRSRRPTRITVTQWYAGKEGEMALKYIFDELRNIADGHIVNMSRRTDTQDVTLNFQRHGQDWQLKFPSNFPRSSASLSYNGEFYAQVCGNTVEKAVSVMINRIS